MLPRPGRLQGRQRHPRPPRGRPAAGRRRRTAHPVRAGDGPHPGRHPAGRPARRRRVRPARRGLHRHRTARRPRRVTARRHPGPVRPGRPAPVGLRLDRCGRAARRRHHPDRADAGRGHHAVLGEGGRQEPLDAVRPGAQRHPGDPPGPRLHPPAGHRPGRVRAGVPAARGHGGRPGARRRGADPLEPPPLRHADAESVHLPGGGGRFDRAARPLGAAHRLPAGARGRPSTRTGRRSSSA